MDKRIAYSLIYRHKIKYKERKGIDTMRTDLYTKEERTIILEEVLNVNVRTDKDIKSLTSSSTNSLKREVINRLYERGLRRSEGALVVQISQCSCDIYKPTDVWAKGNYKKLFNDLQ